jgi:hypothetical protein
MIARTQTQAIARSWAIAFVACFLLATAGHESPRPVSPSAEPAPPLEYRNVPFTAELIRNDDRRFMLAALEWRLQGGVQLRSRDPTLYSIAWFDGGATTGRLRDGRAIVILPHSFGRAPVTEVRTARTPELAGGRSGRNGLTVQAPSHPEIPGYRYIMSENFFGAREYLGLWQRIRDPDDTLIVCFRPASDPRYVRPPIPEAMHRIVGRLPLRLNSLFVYDGLHGASWQLNFTSVARVGSPIYILHYEWTRRLDQPPDRAPSQC